MNKIAQITENKFDKENIKRLNKVFKIFQKDPKRCLLFQKLDLRTIHLRVYVDASFANNDAQTSQLGYTALIADELGKCGVIHYSSHNSRRFVRSVLGEEVYVFAGAFDYSFTLKHDLEKIVKKHVPLKIFTDSRCLFDVITKTSAITEKRLPIDKNGSKKCLG